MVGAVGVVVIDMVVPDAGIAMLPDHVSGIFKEFFRYQNMIQHAFVAVVFVGVIHIPEGFQLLEKQSAV